MTDFLHMGGYAAYVWSSYGISAIVLGANLFWYYRKHQRALYRMKRIHAPGSEIVNESET